MAIGSLGGLQHAKDKSLTVASAWGRWLLGVRVFAQHLPEYCFNISQIAHNVWHGGAGRSFLEQIAGLTQCENPWEAP